MGTIDDALERNRHFAREFYRSSMPAKPARKVVVVTCMDARIDPYAALGLLPGDAHVLSNAGGVVTDDVIRSLVVSQRLLGTEEVMVIHHTDCGMTSFTDDELADRLEKETGSRPPYEFHAIADVDASVREDVARVKAEPFLVHRDRVRGFVYDVATGRVSEVV
jgi:carbonic anhydrase